MSHSKTRGSYCVCRLELQEQHKQNTFAPTCLNAGSFAHVYFYIFTVLKRAIVENTLRHVLCLHVPQPFCTLMQMLHASRVSHLCSSQSSKVGCITLLNRYLVALHTLRHNAGTLVSYPLLHTYKQWILCLTHGIEKPKGSARLLAKSQDM